MLGIIKLITALTNICNIKLFKIIKVDIYEHEKRELTDIGTFGSRLPYVPIYAESSHSRVNIRYIEDT